jgi:hypothetical protein
MLNQSGDQRRPAVVRVLAEPIVQAKLSTPLPQVFGAVLLGVLEFRIRKGAPSVPFTGQFRTKHDSRDADSAWRPARTGTRPRPGDVHHTAASRSGCCDSWNLVPPPKG